MVDTISLRSQAKAEAEHFLKFDQEYRMGYVEAEKPHPLTRRLSQTCAESIKSGAALILQADVQMAQRAAQVMGTEEYAQFADTIRKTLKNGGRVIFSGCGSSGRLSMGLERAWRNAILTLSQQYPQAKNSLEGKLESVSNIMTGGDYAVIRAAESFEDSTKLGMEQAKQLKLCSKDLLVGVTATGETTSILGTTRQALADGAQVYMLICADHKPLVEKMQRAAVVYADPNCRVLSLPCGPMALTGSTRMQSSTFEQLAAAAALETALQDILIDCGIQSQSHEYCWYAEQFLELTQQLLSEKSLNVLSDAATLEQKVYESNGKITLFADNYLLDVLTDTTERSPTFMTPPFCSSDMVGQPQSWAFVKNPTCTTEQAWEKCFLRQPRCIDWSSETYRKLGLNQAQIDKIPDISIRGLKRYMIGCESMPERENSAESYALWVDVGEAPETFNTIASKYKNCGELTLCRTGITLQKTSMEIYEHLAIKLLLNTLSTTVMARMGRIHGNWMTSMAISNKKLMDRGARIVSDLCGVPYEQALEENFYSRLLSDAQELNASPVQMTIERLGISD